MTITKAERIEIEIQEQSMSGAGSKYMVLNIQKITEI